jgi:hypothetical protein
MAFVELQQAITWASQSSNASRTYYPVSAYLTLHNGLTSSNDLNTETNDQVWFAHGLLSYVAATGSKPYEQAHLGGILDSAWAANHQGAMHDVSGDAVPAQKKRTIGITVYADGRVTFQHLLHGDPVGGMPPAKLTGQDVGDVLITCIDGTQVITIGLARSPKYVVPA